MKYPVTYKMKETLRYDPTKTTEVTDDSVDKFLLLTRDLPSLHRLMKHIAYQGEFILGNYPDDRGLRMLLVAPTKTTAKQLTNLAYEVWSIGRLCWHDLDNIHISCKQDFYVPTTDDYQNYCHIRVLDDGYFADFKFKNHPTWTWTKHFLEDELPVKDLRELLGCANKVTGGLRYTP